MNNITKVYISQLDPHLTQKSKAMTSATLHKVHRNNTTTTLEITMWWYPTQRVNVKVLKSCEVKWEFKHILKEITPSETS